MQSVPIICDTIAHMGDVGSIVHSHILSLYIVDTISRTFDMLHTMCQYCWKITDDVCCEIDEKDYTVISLDMNRDLFHESLYLVTGVVGYDKKYDGSIRYIVSWKTHKFLIYYRDMHTMCVF